MVSEDKKEREEYVEKYEQLINEVNCILGPKLKKHKELFISVDVEKWIESVQR